MAAQGDGRAILGRVIAPRSLTSCSSLPPEGANLAWDGPALRCGEAQPRDSRVPQFKAVSTHNKIPMPLKKSEFYSSLWKSCDELRDGMDASQYKDYVLVLLFVRLACL